MGKDWLNNEDGDMYVDPSTGDWAFGESDHQHFQDVLLMEKGELKQFVYIGVGIRKYINAPFNAKIAQDLEKEISLNLEASNAKEVSVSVKSIEDVNITGKYD